MFDEHPPFPNPTIAEVVCDLHFRLPAGVGWNPAFVGDLFKRIGDEYPILEPLNSMNWQLDIGPQGIEQKLLPAPQGVRLKHKSAPYQLQFTESRLTLNVLPPYPGWAGVRSALLDVWQHVAEIIHPSVVGRIGLRYINIIPRRHPTEPLGVLLQACDYIPVVLLKSGPGFLLRAQAQLDSAHRLILTIADAVSSPTEGSRSAIILDIDRIMEQDLTPDAESIQEHLDRLHEDVWDVFTAVQTAELTARLRRESV